ncbi:unnamed protein product [Paramecium primaurelia]|uniref:Uncharacterized protein n=1 Tax=Paramecium primaurelia TaxID=5886 RepID=A0A8S1L8J8_PARPR|nr:unnamed protein product [Paramecium primaurelia]
MRLILLAILCMTLYAQPSPAVIHESWVHYEIELKGKTWPFDANTNNTETAYTDNFILLDAFINQDPKVAEYDLGQTLYSDISAADFKTQFLLKDAIPSYGEARGLSTQNLPVEKVWQHLMEKNAPDAGAHSWAFSAVASVEAYFNRAITDPADYVRLATQQIIDCVTDGKSPLDALLWIKQNGIDLRSTYTTKNCVPKTQEYKIQDIRLVKADKDQLKAALQFTPVTVCFDLTKFQQYINGVINQDCTDGTVNYCGLLLGYENDEWIIQTTLGQITKDQEIKTYWGVEGIVRFHADVAHCGVSKHAAFPMLMNEDIQQLKDDFQNYKEQFQKVYATQEEEDLRFQIWAYAQMDNSELHYFGNTQFTDLTEAEFKQKYLITDFTLQLDKPFISDNILTADDDNIDWRTINVVSDVFDQGDCISSWAIASKNCLESYFRQQTSKYVKLSLQQVIDCSDQLDPLKGCLSGIPTDALKYIKSNGLHWESKYPYTGKAQACAQVEGLQLRPTNYLKLDSINAISQALKQRPAVVCFNASKLQSYTKGIITAQDCGGNTNNYCGLLVGKTPDYWIVQGSFGTTWGLDGYVHIAYGDNCGIQSNAFTII